MRLRLRLRTSDLVGRPGGVTLRDPEEFVVTVGPSGLLPPWTGVDHLRFLSHAHVLMGRHLCLYLDPSREWDPHRGFGGFLDRLRDWLQDAAAGAFDSQTALFHAVGGVLHATEGAPTIVVRGSLREGVRAQHGWLVRRQPHRLDLLLHRPAAAADGYHVPVVTLDASLPLTAGATLHQLLSLVEDPYAGHPGPGSPFRTRPASSGLSALVLTTLGASAARKPAGSPQSVVLAVPHPAGGPPRLLAAELPAITADRLRALASASRKQHTMTEIDPAAIVPDVPLTWLAISDERAEVTTRRDSTRPVAAFAGRTVQVWGCGGLGSWVAEYVVRAGARRVVLCDPGTITGGLLVRQNFGESDIGDRKVEALERRLRAINDLVEVCTHPNMTPEGGFDGADVVIDTTVSVAISRYLDTCAAQPGRPVLAQMATDTRTGTLGVLTVSMPALPHGPLTIDHRSGTVVRADGSLEVFYGMWAEDSAGDDLVPTRGCSAPTFHGSAADLAAVAASLTSILGLHLGAATAVSGTHLISLPHGDAGPRREFLPYEASSAPEAAA